MTDNAFEVARPIAQPANEAYPIIGETTVGLGEHLVRSGKLPTLESFQPIRRDALAIVRSCRRFDAADGTRTGLVVGYVQSGKTLSMTTVSALARDNGCRIIILLAGVTTNLLQQNANRFKEDLRKASGKTAWRIYNSQDGLGDPELQRLRQAVAEWRDPSFSEKDGQTFLYLVLKNHAHLDRLHSHLSGVDLHGVPALILDDEADQAGLNTSPGESEASTTYQRILRVRGRLPHHTYLQYTATPQAPLLIALDDLLSPAFAELVEPGEGYTGGQSFFGGGSPPGLVRAIPDDELFKPGAPPEGPPESLLEAMRIFFVGCAVAAIRGRPNPRSMLVHPSPRQTDHRRYLSWVQEITNRWATALRSADVDERNDTLDEFRAAYDDLAQSDRNLPPFDNLIQRLQISVGRVSLKEVNSQDGSEVDWENADEHILVGGEKLNRGFTVEGLIVTYMPRDAGEWNADTIQQRARFFGYKASYLSLCRLYLHPDVVHAYRAYVRHEEDVRSQLAEHRGRPLREWRRAFFLDAKMRPTRRNVLFDPYYRIRSDRPWFVQEQPHFDPDAANRNASMLRDVEKSTQFSAEEGYFRHSVCELPLKDFFRDVLLGFEVRGSDVASWYGQLVMLRDILEGDANARVVLVKMDGTRERTITDGEIKLHQGRSSSKGADKYPGDAKMCDPSIVTVQIHWLAIPGISSLQSPIPALAIHIPTALRKDDLIAQGA